MAYNKLHRKDFVIAIKTGSDETKFAMEAVEGELFLKGDGAAATLWIATSTADGDGDATVKQVTLS